LPAAHRVFFLNTRARKATAGKSGPETTDTAGKSRPSGIWRETFYNTLPEKGRPENPGKGVTKDTAGKFGCQ
jgi:hypothetical protein